MTNNATWFDGQKARAHEFPMPNLTARRMTGICLSRIIQQIQCIDDESRDQPFFRNAA
jgi:hypothetical protein